MLCRLLKGVFNIRPALPRYVTARDVTKVFTFIKSKPALTNYDLKTPSHRLAAGQRDKTIKCLNLDYIKISSDKVVLFVLEILKTTRPGHHLPPVELKTFKESELCVVAHLKQHPLEILVQTNYYRALYNHINQSQPQLSQGGV